MTTWAVDWHVGRKDPRPRLWSWRPLLSFQFPCVTSLTMRRIIKIVLFLLLFHVYSVDNLGSKVLVGVFLRITLLLAPSHCHTLVVFSFGSTRQHQVNSVFSLCVVPTTDRKIFSTRGETGTYPQIIELDLYRKGGQINLSNLLILK